MAMDNKPKIPKIIKGLFSISLAKYENKSDKKLLLLLLICSFDILLLRTARLKQKASYIQTVTLAKTFT